MDKKQLKEQYRNSKLPMGVYKIACSVNGKIFIDSGLNLDGKMNGCRFQLSSGLHANKALQADFAHYGASRFTFEVLDRLEPDDDADKDYDAELALLEAMWKDRLKPYGERGYNLLET